MKRSEGRDRVHFVLTSIVCWIGLGAFGSLFVWPDAGTASPDDLDYYDWLRVLTFFPLAVGMWVLVVLRDVKSYSRASGCSGMVIWMLHIAASASVPGGHYDGSDPFVILVLSGVTIPLFAVMVVGVVRRGRTKDAEAVR